MILLKKCCSGQLYRKRIFDSTSLSLEVNSKYLQKFGTYILQCFVHSSTDFSADSYHSLLVGKQELDAFFRPKQVTLVVGDVPIDRKLHMLWKNLQDGTKLFNLEAASVGTTERYGKMFTNGLKSVEDLRGPIDLVVIATHVSEVQGVLHSLAKKGTKACLLSSLITWDKLGTKETQNVFREIASVASQHQIRLIGSDSLGILNCRLGLNVSSSLSRDYLPGQVALLSQSGSLICSLLDWSVKERFGFSGVADVGTMLDVDWADLIHYFGNDRHTHSILIYAEGIGNVRRFLSAAREVAVSKPIMLIKPYKLHISSKTVSTRPISGKGTIPKELKGPLDLLTFDENAVLDEVFRRSGVLRVESVNDLFLTARVLAHQPRPLGSKLTIISNAGGPGYLAADQLIAGGGQLSSLSAKVSSKIQKVLPSHLPTVNPIDLSGNASANDYKEVLEACFENAETDGALVILTPQTMTQGTETAQVLADMSNQWREKHKPLLTSFMGGKELMEAQEILRNAQIPNFAFSDTAASVWNYLWRYNEYLQSLYQVPDSGLSEVAYWKESQRTAEAMLRSIQKQGRSLMTEIESKKLLQIYQIPVVDTRVAKEEEEAVEMAKELGFPVVLKLHSETIIHKSEVGGVKLNLTSSEAVKYAFRSIRESCGRLRGRQHFQGVVIYRMIDKPRDTHEVMLGSMIDSQAGPVIQFGTGGSLVHVYEDFAIALPPLNTHLARQMMSRTKIYGALVAARKTLGVDTRKIEEIVERFSRMVTEQAAFVKACEINPIIVGPKTILVADARVWLHEVSKHSPQLTPSPAIRPYPSEYVFSWPGDSMGTPPFLVRPIRPEDVHRFKRFMELILKLKRNESSISDSKLLMTATLPEDVPMELFEMLSHDNRWKDVTLQRLNERVVSICHADYSTTITLVAETMDSESGEMEFHGFASLCLRKGTKEEGVISLIMKENNTLANELFRRLIVIAKQESLSKLTFCFHEKEASLEKLGRQIGFHFEKQGSQLCRATKIFANETRKENLSA
ncbi:Acetate--CoA ligase [ADP-forming] [Galdieria sulphuraria]|nr:Acetate--CoA ligase [ADP-forming] [Galdieria sulphuraria]